MGIQVQWDNDERTTIYVHAETRRHMSDAYAAMQQIQQMIASVEHDVDMIVYIEKIVVLERNYLQHFSHLVQMMPPRLTRAVGVSPDDFMRDLLRVTEHLLGGLAVKLTFASSVAEARRQLARERHESVASAVGAD